VKEFVVAEIPSIGQGAVGPINRTVPTSAYQATETLRQQSEPLGDRVELSRHALLLDRLRNLPGVREDLVQTVRQAIADGTYATDAKLDIAVQRMLDDPS